MSSSVDERIVEMTFKGESFLSGVTQAIAGLTKLKNGLDGMKGSSDDLNNLDTAAKKFSLSGISDSLDGIKSKFSAMGVAGITVISSLVNKAVDAGLSILKAFTIDPIKAGLASYETKINAIQTILSNTASEGTNLSQVTAALNTLNAYSNLTVYNFADMAKNIGTFTAAGVGLQTSVSSIKGIANLAALSGASAGQASTGMYQLSQAIAAGVVKLQDWNSVVNAGFGGKVFQNALIETARVNGVAVDQMIAKYGSFRQSLQSGWLSAKILTETLSEFTGDLSTKQLEAMGFTLAESQAIEKQAALAVQSATQIRTFSQLADALKDDVSTAYAGVFEAIIGNFSQAPKLLTSLFNELSSVLITPINNLAKLITNFRQLGGFGLIIQGIIEIFKSLGQIVSTVGDAFEQVFPVNGGNLAQALIKIAIAFQNLAQKMEPSKATLADLKTIFVGVFSAINLVISVIEALFGGLGKITGAATGAGGGILNFVASIAQFITKVSNAVTSGSALTTFFNDLGDILAIPVKVIGTIIDAFGGLGSAISSLVAFAQPAIQKIGSVFSTLGDAIANGIKSGSFQNVANLINEGLIAAILLKVKSFIKGLGQSSGSGLLDTIKESFEGLTSALKSMQTTLKSDVLEKIAISVALLAASLIALSFINVQNLTKALTAITVLFSEMLTALSVITKVSSSSGILKMVAIGVALNLLATAIVILSGAVAILSRFSWTELAKGLGSIAVLLGLLVAAIALMDSDTTGTLASAYAMETMAVAMNVMSEAVKRLGALDFGTLAKGIGSVAALLALLTAFNLISGGEKLISTAAAMVIMGAALLVIGQAVKQLGSLPTDVLVKGLLAIAGALLLIAIAMEVMPPDMLLTATSLLIVASALVIMAKALTTMGGMSWGEIGKSMVELFGALTLVAAATIAMTEALPGAAALIIVAAALAILAPVLVVLGGLSWDAIAKGMVALAGVFLILGLAGALLGPVVPVLIGLGAAIALLGVGVLAAGLGITLLAAGITALAISVAASGAAILSFVTSILSLIPLTFEKIGEGIVQFAKAIGDGTVAFTQAFEAIFTAILNAVIKVVPLAGTAFEAIMNEFLKVITQDAPKIITAFANFILMVITKMTTYVPKFVDAGAAFIVAVLNGISSKVSAVVTAAVNLVVSFINSIGSGAQKIVTAGVNMVINLINGIANQIKKSSPALNAAASNLASAIIEGLVSGISGGISGVVNAIINVAESALSAAKKTLGINSPSKEFAYIGDQIPAGVAMGITRSQSVANDAVVASGASMLDTLSKTMSAISDTVGTNLDLQPKITPVVDLTQAKAGFGQLNDLSKAQLIAASASASSASSISAANAAAASAAGIGPSSGTSLTFNQYNSSPEALSATDIYRRTKNQLSIAKGALT